MRNLESVAQKMAELLHNYVIFTQLGNYVIRDQAIETEPTQSGVLFSA